MTGLDAWIDRRWAAWLTAVVVLALGVRLVFVHVPAASDALGFRPYTRAVHYQQAAALLLEGEPAGFREGHRRAISAAWKASGHRLPPDADTVPIPPGDPVVPFYDERGYLLFTTAIAAVTGRVAYADVLSVHAVLSALAAAGVATAARAVRPGLLALSAGALFALHPLELVLTAMPDLPVFAVWAVVLGVLAVLLPLTPGRPAGAAALVGCGAGIGVAVVLRAPTAAMAATTLVGLVLAGGRAGLARAGWVGLGLVLGFVLPALVPLDVPAVGRSAFWHTLLGGLAEFGHLPGLAWNDAVFDAYMQERHAVVLGDPGFSEAARTELLAVLAERPTLPLEVTAWRLGTFLAAYRPGKESLVWIGLMWGVKLLGVLGFATWWVAARGREHREVLAVLLVVLAPLLAHALIVPLLEVYVAPTLVGLTLVGLVAGVGLVQAAVARRGPAIRTEPRPGGAP